MLLDKNKILKLLNRKQAFVEVNLKENSTHISYIIVSSNKGSLIIVKKGNHVSSLNELKNKLPNSIPTHYIFTGNGILFRILQNPNNLDVSGLIEYCFSTIDLKTVYYTSKNEGDSYFLSLIRKEKLNEFVSELKKHDLAPTTVYFGQSNITVLGKYIEQSNNSIETGGLLFNFKDRVLSSISKVDTEEPKYYTIGDEQIESDYIVAFSTALIYFGQNDGIQSCNDTYSLNQYYTSDRLYKQLYNISWKSAVGFLFVVLLINFFLFDKLNKRNNELLQNIYQLEKGRDVKIQKAIQTKEEMKILSEFGFLYQYTYTQYVDELSNSLLNGMYFNELKINPQINGKTNKKIAFNTGKISLEGKNLKKAGIDKYKESINNKKWVKSTNIKSVSRKGSNSSYYFAIDIDIIH
jgi:hypothetical protein